MYHFVLLRLGLVSKASLFPNQVRVKTWPPAGTSGSRMEGTGADVPVWLRVVAGHHHRPGPGRRADGDGMNRQAGGRARGRWEGRNSAIGNRTAGVGLCPLVLA